MGRQTIEIPPVDEDDDVDDDRVYKTTRRPTIENAMHQMRNKRDESCNSEKELADMRVGASVNWPAREPDLLGKTGQYRPGHGKKPTLYATKNKEKKTISNC